MKNYKLIIIIVIFSVFFQSCQQLGPNGLCIPVKLKYIIDYEKTKFKHRGITFLSSNKNILAIVEDANSTQITLREATTGDLVNIIDPGYQISHLVIHPQKSLLVVVRSHSSEKLNGDQNCIIDIWNYITNKKIGRITIPPYQYKYLEGNKDKIRIITSQVLKSQFTPDGKYLAVSRTTISGIELWDVTSLQMIKMIGNRTNYNKKGWTGEKSIFSISQDSRKIAFIERDFLTSELFIHINEIDTNKNIFKSNNSLIVDNIKFAFENDYLLLKRRSGTYADLWSLETQDVVAKYQNVNSLRASCIKSGLVAIGEGDGNLSYYDKLNKKVLAIPSGCEQDNKDFPCNQVSEKKGHTRAIILVSCIENHNLLITVSSESLIVWECN